MLIALAHSVAGRKVVPHEPLESGPVEHPGPIQLTLSLQLVRNDGGNQVVLGREVGIEGAVGQTRICHEGRDPGTVDAITLETTAGSLNDPPSRRVLVLPAVSRHGPSLLEAGLRSHPSLSIVC